MDSQDDFVSSNATFLQGNESSNSTFDTFHQGPTPVSSSDSVPKPTTPKPTPTPTPKAKAKAKPTFTRAVRVSQQQQGDVCAERIDSALGLSVGNQSISMCNCKTAGAYETFCHSNNCCRVELLAAYDMDREALAKDIKASCSEYHRAGNKNAYLHAKLNGVGGIQPKERTVSWNGHRVCLNTFAWIHGVSSNKMTDALKGQLKISQHKFSARSTETIWKTVYAFFDKEVSLLACDAPQPDSRHNIYKTMAMLKVDNLFDAFTAEKGEDYCTFTYFKKLWFRRYGLKRENKELPYVKLESDVYVITYVPPPGAFNTAPG